MQCACCDIPHRCWCPQLSCRQRQQGEDSEDDSDDGGDDFWLSPRMACRLHAAGCFYVDEYCRGGDPDCVRDDMPGVVQPYAKGKQWMEAYEQAAMRLVRRFEKGLEPQPNCTGGFPALGVDSYTM
jgi:hypothetical protein